MISDQDSRILSKAIEKLVKACAEKSIPAYTEEEQDMLLLSLSSASAISQETDKVCSLCGKKFLFHMEVGNCIAKEVASLVDSQRAEMNLLVRKTKAHTLGSVEIPEKCVRVRRTTPDVQWQEVDNPGRDVVIKEFYYNSLVLIEDKIAEQGGTCVLSALYEQVSRVLTNFLEQEKIVLDVPWEHEHPNSKLIRVVGLRKSIDARSVDTYNQGRPARGWFFESIQGYVDVLVA